MDKVMDAFSLVKWVHSDWFFSHDAALYTASTDRSIRSFDVHGNASWAQLRAHE
jgi:hypothetical protein